MFLNSRVFEQLDFSFLWHIDTVLACQAQLDCVSIAALARDASGHKFQSSPVLQKPFVSGSPKTPLAPTPLQHTKNAIAAPLKDAGRVVGHAPLVARRVAEQRGLLPPGRHARRAD